MANGADRPAGNTNQWIYCTLGIALPATQTLHTVLLRGFHEVSTVFECIYIGLDFVTL